MLMYGKHLRNMTTLQYVKACHFTDASMEEDSTVIACINYIYTRLFAINIMNTVLVKKHIIMNVTHLYIYKQVFLSS